MSIPGLPEAFACDRCARPNLLGDIQPGETLTCVGCGHAHVVTQEFVHRLQSGVNARTLADVQASFSAPPVAPSHTAPPSAPHGTAGTAGPPPDNPKLGLRGRSAGALTAPAAGNLLTPRREPDPEPAPAPAPAFGQPSWDAAPPPPPPPAWNAAPPVGPGGAPDVDAISTNDALPAWAVGGPPLAGAPPGPPLGDQSFSAVPPPPPATGGPGHEPWAGALPPMPSHTRTVVPPRSNPSGRPEMVSSVAADLPRKDPTVWKGSLLRKESEVAEASGKKFALLTSSVYTGCVLILLLFAAVGVGGPGQVGQGIGFATALDGILPLLAIGAGGICAAIWAPSGMIRGWICLSIGMAPLVYLFIMLLSWPIEVPTPLMAALLVPVLTMFVYGGSAAFGQCFGSDWLRERTAAAALCLIGLILWLLMGAQDQLPPVFQLGFSMVFVMVATVLCAAPLFACYNYIGNSQGLAHAIPVIFWASYIAPITFMVFMSGGFLAALIMIASIGSAVGWMFVGGAGFRDLMVHADLEGRAKKANVQLDSAAPQPFAAASPMSPDAHYQGYQPESGEPFSG